MKRGRKDIMDSIADAVIELGEWTLKANIAKREADLAANEINYLNSRLVELGRELARFEGEHRNTGGTP